MYVTGSIYLESLHLLFHFFTFFADHLRISLSPCETLLYLTSACPEAISTIQTVHSLLEKHDEFETDSDSDGESERDVAYLTKIIIVDTFPIKVVDTRKWRSFEQAAANVVDFLNWAPLFKDSSGFLWSPLLVTCFQSWTRNRFDCFESETGTRLNNWQQLLNLFALCECPEINSICCLKY